MPEAAAPQPPAPCAPSAGRVIPIIDRNRCEAKGACVAACPYGVFEIAALTGQQRAQLSWRGRIKAFLHGGRQAFTVHADRCHACGLCVKACPEDAIHLAALPQAPSPERIPPP